MPKQWPRLAGAVVLHRLTAKTDPRSSRGQAARP